MARSGVSGSDPGAVVAAARVTELKKELQRLVRTIVEEEDFKVETVDQAREALFALKELKLRKKRSASMKVDDGVSCPQEFRCPLSKDFMRDPVVVSTGQTYDRPFIQKWLKAGNRTCPLTQQVLSHTILTPNHLIRDMISQWCKCQGIELSDPTQYLNDEDGITDSERDRFLSLIGKMSASPPEQKDAARELRSLTKRMPSFRALFGESTDAIPRLLRPLEDNHVAVGPEIQEDVITTLLNLSIHDSNKRLVAETPAAVPLLMEALRSGTAETRCNAAAALFTLSAVDSNKALIGRSGALRPLIDLLEEEGNPAAVKDAASAIFNICIAHDNKVRAVREGAVKVILGKISGPTAHVDELVAILAMLATHQRAVEEMSEAVPRLLGVIRESGCDRTKENCAAILHSICVTHRSKWREMREEERAHGTLTELSRNGTSRAKRKASGILERLNRAVNLTHTA